MQKQDRNKKDYDQSSKKQNKMQGWIYIFRRDKRKKAHKSKLI